MLSPCVKHYLRPIAKLIVEWGAYHKLMNECLHSSIALHIIEWDFRLPKCSIPRRLCIVYFIFIRFFRKLWFLNVKCWMFHIACLVCSACTTRMQFAIRRIACVVVCCGAARVLRLHFINSQYFGNVCVPPSKWLADSLPLIFISLIYW